MSDIYASSPTLVTQNTPLKCLIETLTQQGGAMGAAYDCPPMRMVAATKVQAGLPT